jgi:hypothetical protein
VSDNVSHDDTELQHSDTFANEGASSDDTMLTTDVDASVAELEQDKYRHSTTTLELASADDHANAFSNDNLIHSEVRVELQCDYDVVDTRVDTGNNVLLLMLAIMWLIQTQVLVLALLLTSERNN